MATSRLIFALLVAAVSATAGVVLDVTPTSATLRDANSAEAAALDALPAQAAALDAERDIERQRPAEFPSGIAVPASGVPGGRPVMRIDATADGNVIAYVAHASPYDPAVAESNRVAAVAQVHNQRHALRELRAAVALAKDMTTTNIADVLAINTSATTAAAQQTQIDAMRKELLDTNRRLKDALQFIQDVRRLLLAAYKESEP